MTDDARLKALLEQMPDHLRPMVETLPTELKEILLSLPGKSAEDLARMVTEQAVECFTRQADWPMLAAQGVTAFMHVLDHLPDDGQQSAQTRMHVQFVTALLVAIGMQPPTTDSEVFAHRVLMVMEEPREYLKGLVTAVKQNRQSKK